MRRFLAVSAVVLALWLPLYGSNSSLVTDAAEDNNLAALKTLVAQKADVNATQIDGDTALLWAVHWDNTEAVDLLLTAGADVKKANRFNATPLYVAAEAGNARLIAKLLAAGADPNQTILTHGETPLMFAARSGNVESVRLLLDKGADLEAREKMRGSTPLLWAAEQQHAEVLKLLIARGAKLNAQTATGSPKPAKGKEPKGEVDDDGFTALILATREGGLESMKILLDGGAPINQQATNGNTALIVAAMNQNAAVINFLLERGANVNLANDKGWTPLYLTVKARTMETGTMPNPAVDQQGLFKAIEFMVEHGAEVNARIGVNTEVHSHNPSTWLKEPGATALLRAAFGGDLAVIKLLLAHGADPNIPTADNTTALMALAGVGHFEGFLHDFGTEDESLEAMKILISLGAKVNAVNDSNVAALHGAAHKNFVKGIEYLAANGADFTLRSKYKSQYDGKYEIGYIPLDWALGVTIGPTSSIYHEEAVTLISKLMVERGLEPVGVSMFKGGNAKDAGGKKD